MNSKFYLMRIRTYAQQMENEKIDSSILEIWADHMSADWGLVGVNVKCDALTAELLNLSVAIIQHDTNEMVTSCKKIVEMCRDLMTIA